MDFCSGQIRVDSDDCDTMVMRKPIYIKSKNQHICTECEGVIQKEEEFECITNADDKTVYRTCESCQDIRREFFEGGWVYTEIWEYIEQDLLDCEGRFDEGLLFILKKPARDKLCAIIDDVYKLLGYK